MSYLMEFYGTNYYDGFKRCMKPIPDGGIYQFVGGNKRKGIYHLLKEGADMRERISIKKDKFKVIRKKEEGSE